MSGVPLKIVPCIFRNALRCISMGGITMPWRTIYLLPEYANHHDLIRHEMVHIEQIKRDGALAFSVKYLWWLLRYGYWDNPYEVEAYKRAPIEEG